MNKRYLIILLTVINFHPVSGKEGPDSHLKKLADNGIELIERNTDYSSYQYYLLETHDFLQYRNFTTRRVVQIEDGPKLLLYSLSEMMAAGNTIPQETIDRKKGETISTTLTPIITRINIGFRYLPKKNTESGY